MRDQLQLRENLGDPPARFRLQRAQLLEQQGQPAGRPGNQADVFLQRQRRQALDLFLPVGDEGQRLRREIPAADPPRHVARGDAADIAAVDARRLFLQIGRAAEHERLAVEDATVRASAQVVDEDIERRLLFEATISREQGMYLTLPVEVPEDTA